MHQTNLLDETLDRNQSHNYNLLMQCSLNGFSFCLFDTVRYKFIAFRHYPFQDNLLLENLACIFTTDDLLKLSYKTTVFLINESKNTLAPISFFDDKDSSLYYQFNHGEENEHVLHNNLPDILAVNIFSYAPEFIAKIKEFFPDIKFLHRVTPFITDLIQESAKGYKTRFFAGIHEGFVDIGMAHQKKLEFFNTFEYKEKQDIVYYILNVLEQFKLSTMHTDVFISVDLENHEEIFEFLSNYIHHVKFIKPSEKYTYSYVFDEFQLTRFSNLFNLALCV